MPFTINGIGTWYYGQRHIHTYDGTCQFCGSAAKLTSYDTTLFLVFVFVPVIPLGRKRILEECPYCQRHRVLGLSEWEAAKGADVADVRARLRRDPADRDAAIRGVMLAAAYQDEPLLSEIVELTRDAHPQNAAFHAQLGDTFGFFARWPQAGDAYRAALDVEDNESVSEALAWTLLKQGRAQEARPYLEHVLTQRKEPSAYLIYHLINGYQAEGLHEEALALIDARDRAFPAQAVLKECQKQRKTSTRNQGTQKRIRGASLLDKGGAGYRQGWSGSVPYWIAALILVGIVGSYFGSAIWIGEFRKVHLVNGTRKAYTVSVAGQDYVLNPGTVKPIRVAEGDVEVAFADAKLGHPTINANVESSFWTRPFANHAFIINPDQTALIIQEQTIYSAKPQPGQMGPPPVFHFGQPFYQVSGMDYEFEEFPQTLQIKGSQTVTKSRIAMGPPLSDEARIEFIMQRVPQRQQEQICERLIQFEPNNTMLLYLLASRIDAARMLKILEARLDERPINVDWHRLYQSTMEKVEPNTDLRPRYEKLLTAMNGNADALYLLGRAEQDLDKSERLIRQAAEANPPSGFAAYSLGYRALSAGQFPEAVVQLEKAMKLMPANTIYRPIYHDALLAAGDFDRLLAELRAQLQTSERKVVVLMEICRTHAIRGQKAEARAALTQAIQILPADQQQAVRQSLESSLCCWENNLDGYLKAEAPFGFEVAFLRGQLNQAADWAGAGLNKNDANAFYGLLYLEAKRTGDNDRADQHWQSLIKNLKNGPREERRFAEGLEQAALASEFHWRRVTLETRGKRVLLVVLAERHPAQAQVILELAKKLDYQRDGTSLCLRKAVPAMKK